MIEITKQAEALNTILQRETPTIYELLSESGRKAFFPHLGILGQTQEAKGTDINVTIGQAFEDNGTPMILNCFLDDSSLTPQSFLYSPSYGQMELRKLWKSAIYKKNPSLESIKISLPVVTGGITHGLSLVGNMFVDREDGIIISDKFWGNYKLTYPQSNFHEYPCFDGRRFNLGGLKSILSGKDEKKIVLLNFPNNPSGYTPTNQEVEQITGIIEHSAKKGNKITVICDDAYFGLIYDDDIFKESIFSKLADLHENVLAVKLDGLTKEAFFWGGRIGFITYGFKGMTDEVASVLEDKTAGVVRGSVSNLCTISQNISIKGLQSPNFESQRTEKYEILKERFECIKQTLNEHSEYKEFFELLPFNSGYFMCVELRQHNGDQIRSGLIKNHKTGVVAVGNLLRIAYSSESKDKIPQLFTNIYVECKNTKTI